MKTVYAGRLLALTLVVLLAGCASSKKAAETHPWVGAWEISIDTPIGVQSGEITVIEEDGQLKALMDGESGAMDVSNIAFEDNAMNFSIDTGEYGIMDVNLMVEGDALSGTLLSEYGDMPITGKRKSAGM